VRLCLILISALLTGCAAPPAPPPQLPHDPTTESWYGSTVDQLATINRQAKEDFEKGKSDEAAKLIQQGETLSKRLISVPKPTLAATEAASDLDQLYGRMLFSNRNYGWARLFFQKNLARWKHWQPHTPETAKRVEEARTAIAECDSRLGQ
jgi:hypothetical protein